MANTCPKCGHAGVEADTCSRCRVIVWQYRAYLLRRREKRFRPLVRGIRGSTLYWVVLFIIVIGANIYLLLGSAPRALWHENSWSGGRSGSRPFASGGCSGFGSR